MVKSPIPDEILPNITLHELAYEHFRVHKNKVALVSITLKVTPHQAIAKAKFIAWVKDV